VIDRLPQRGPKADYVKQALRDKLTEHREYICQNGEDLPEIRHWQWEDRPQTICSSRANG
jgi:xylulose-5-phosphate/fructose-6-phosphate phosphoketolase